MINKKVRSSLRWIVLAIIPYFLWGFLDALKMKTRIVDTLLSVLPRRILQMAVPDFIFLLIIIVVLVILWKQQKRFKGLSPERFKEMLADNQRMQKRNDLLIETFNNAIKRNEKIFEDYSTVKNRYPHLFDNPPDMPLVFKDDVCWKKREGAELEGPFCPKCYDEHRRQSHMIKVLNSDYYKCPVCDLRVARPSGRLGPPILS